MDEQESYLNEEEVNQSLNNAGNKINQFGQGMYNGVRQGINDYKNIKNHGLQSAYKDLNDNKKEPEIPEPKNQNTNPTGVVNPSTGNDNQNSLPNKDNDLKDKDKDKKDDKNSDKKDDDKDDKRNKDDKEKKSSLKEKLNEKSPFNKLNKKIEEKLDPAKVLFKKVKLYGSLVLLGCALIFVLIIALVGGTAIHTTLHNITEDFV